MRAGEETEKETYCLRSIIEVLLKDGTNDLFDVVAGDESAK